jgi:enoyl-CoA hydratase/carnithine racemase
LSCVIRNTGTDQLLCELAGGDVSGDFGGGWFLTQMVGVARAKDLYFSGRSLARF